MLTEKEKKGWEALDKAATKAGGYLATPVHPHIVDADYRAMSKYCREKGIKPMDLTGEEYKIFLYEKPLVYS